jgi:hypothetical protein
MSSVRRSKSLPKELDRLYDALIKYIDEVDRAYVYRALGNAIAAAEDVGSLPEEVYWMTDIDDVDLYCQYLKTKENRIERSDPSLVSSGYDSLVVIVVSWILCPYHIYQKTITEKSAGASQEIT